VLLFPGQPGENLSGVRLYLLPGLLGELCLDLGHRVGDLLRQVFLPAEQHQLLLFLLRFLLSRFSQPNVRTTSSI
jgi:hypothetical protein